MFNQNENQRLKELVNINKDACAFYGSACEKADDPNIKMTFRNMEDAHGSVVVNLQNYMEAKGAETEPAEQTMTGQVTQFWGELMSEISNDVDETLVTHLEEAEDRCLISMRDAINDSDLRPETVTVLQNELAVLRQSHDYMKELKEKLKAA